jgi:UDP-N-acetylglucosamine 2-epimerase
MKTAPIMREMARHHAVFQQVLLHTGQHYDENMSDRFFAQLGMGL